MTQHTPGPCGCKTDVNEVLYYPFIVYCPLHAAAPELLGVLTEAVHDHDDTYHDGDPSDCEACATHDTWSIARAAIAKATGGA